MNKNKDKKAILNYKLIYRISVCNIEAEGD